MKKPMTPEELQSLAAQIVVGLWGLLLSIVLHEAFHIYMHWGHITHVNFFPDLWTVVSIDTAIPPGYDLEGEELAAYGISLLVALITVAIIFKIRDTDDTRSVGETIFPDDKEMQKMDPTEMLELSGLEDPEQKPPEKPQSYRKKKGKKP